MPTRKHCLLFAFPAFGHYIPMVELAKRIIPHHDVTMVISSTKEHDIRQRYLLPPPPIGFYPINDHIHVNFDENFTELRLLLDIIDITRPYYAEFVESLNTDCSPLPHVDAVFCDINQHAPCDPCKEKCIPLYIVNILSTFLMAKSFTVERSTPTVPDETFFNDEVDGVKTADLPIQESIKTLVFGHQHVCRDAKAILFNSFEELEPGGLELFKRNPRTKDKMLKLIGPLTTPDEPLTDGGLAEKVARWMDRQEKKSVVYFSFGSVCIASKEQIIQVADALVSLNRPFVWSLRPIQQGHLSQNMTRSTAEDFDLESKYLIIPWAPQKMILSHSATALFVSHCGWNSTLEAVHFGVPIVAWPMFGDQHFNASLVEKLGVGITVKGTGMHKKRAVTAAEIVRVIRNVSGWESNTQSHSATSYCEKMKTISQKARDAVDKNGNSAESLMAILQNI